MDVNADRKPPKFLFGILVERLLLVGLVVRPRITTGFFKKGMAPGNVHSFHLDPVHKTKI